MVLSQNILCQNLVQLKLHRVWLSSIIQTCNRIPPQQQKFFIHFSVKKKKSLTDPQLNYTHTHPASYLLRVMVPFASSFSLSVQLQTDTLCLWLVWNISCVCHGYSSSTLCPIGNHLTLSPAYQAVPHHQLVPEFVEVCSLPGFVAFPALVAQSFLLLHVAVSA